MKKLIFVLLKIAEISLIPIAYYLLTFIGWLSMNFLGVVMSGYEFWHFKYNLSFWFALQGFISSIFIFGIGMILYLAYLLIPDFFREWITKNKEWSESISKYIKSKTVK